MQVSEAVSTIVWMILYEQRLLVQFSHICIRKVANMLAQFPAFPPRVSSSFVIRGMGSG